MKPYPTMTGVAWGGPKIKLSDSDSGSLTVFGADVRTSL